MNGKALFFKTIAVPEKDIRSDYQRVPSNLTGAGCAAGEKRNEYVAAKR
jgi:hypothetical protein